jgi:histone H3/H4
LHGVGAQATAAAAKARYVEQVAAFEAQQRAVETPAHGAGAGAGAGAGGDEEADAEAESATLSLPASRIKRILKADPECGNVSSDAAFLVTAATEFFVSLLAAECANAAEECKRAMCVTCFKSILRGQKLVD